MTYVYLQGAEALCGEQHTFLQDAWSRPPGTSQSSGHGITAVVEGSSLLEKVSGLQAAAALISMLQGRRWTDLTALQRRQPSTPAS